MRLHSFPTRRSSDLKNFFYESWLGAEELVELNFYIQCAFWLVLWCLLLLWALTGRLRRGLQREIDQLCERWKQSGAVTGLFARLDDDCRQVKWFRQDLDQLAGDISRLRQQLALPDENLGHRR